MMTKKYPLPGEVYEYYKGGTYEVITLCTHTESNEKLVIYKSLNFGSIYARNLEEFMSTITVDGWRKINRFNKKTI